MAAVSAREDLHTAIERALDRHFAERTAAAEAYGEEFSLLWRLAARHARGGKLLRPTLLIQTYDALAGARSTARLIAPERSAVVDLAVAVELLHYSFLLHDDVIDGDVLRRRMPNLIGALRDSHPDPQDHPASPLHWAQSGAILMGDLLLSAAHQGFARADVDRETRLRLLDLLDHTVTETVAGEQADVALSDGVTAPDLQTILSMTARKTAAYSFELPLRAAAILAGAPDAVETALTAYGRHLGLAFQLQDDLLSVFGDPAQHGKDAHSDLREGKETALIAYARMTSSWPRIELRFGHADLGPDEAAEIREQLVACGAEAFARGLVDEQLTAAYGVLADSDTSAALPPEAQGVLLGLADRIDGRRS